ncbi:MAG: SPOR domain-containing protein [Proteobacteria bacterium]|nr:SPOR domain-containing protein [Pseudomonadota bacterium]
MPKDYKNIKSDKNKSARNSKYLKSFLAGLTVGLCVAIIVYFYQHDVAQQTQIIQPQVTVAKPAPELSQNDDTPPPTFDFYQILPNMEVNVSEWEAEDDGDIEEQADLGIENTGIYILQIGSFKRFDAADEVKAKLAFMGISADIQRVVINGKDIRHRVRVGPYADSEKLSRIRRQLTENNLSYMLLKLQSEN